MNSVKLKIFLEIELGFLMIDLFIDTFIDIIVSLLKTRYEIIYWRVNVTLVLILLLCITSLLATCVSLTLENEHFLKAAAFTQILYMLTIALKTFGYLIDYVPKYWSLNWISVFHVVASCMIPGITLVLIAYIIYIKDKQILSRFRFC